jgi:hypothetical protein
LENVSRIFASWRKENTPLKSSNDEFNQLQHNQSKLISVKEYLIGTTEQSSSLTMCTSSTERSDLISVLFEIECNLTELNEDFIFTDITQFMELPSQQIILFDFNTTFCLENIQQSNELWLIKLTVLNDGQSIIEKYINDVYHQIENLSIPIIFGKLICNMSQWNQSQIYFEHLLNDLHNEDLAWIEHSLGQCHQWKGEWNQPRIYYDRAYDRMIQTKPAHIKDFAIIYSLILVSYCIFKVKDEEALDFHNQALAI